MKDIYFDDPKHYSIDMRHGGAKKHVVWSHLWTEPGMSRHYTPLQPCLDSSWNGFRTSPDSRTMTLQKARCEKPAGWAL